MVVYAGIPISAYLLCLQRMMFEENFHEYPGLRRNEWQGFHEVMSPRSRIMLRAMAS